MLFPELKLYFQISFPGGLHDFARLQWHLGKAFTTFNSGHTDVRTKIQIAGQSLLSDRNFERTTARRSDHPVTICDGDLSSHDCFIRNQPTRHRNLQCRYKMTALLEMALE